MTLLDMARQLEGENPAVNHYATCNADYPKKPENEKPQQIESMDIGDGETVHQCVDCGAHKVTNAHGVDVTDADLPDNMQPEPTPALVLTPTPAPVDPSQPHKITDVDAAYAFLMAGNAYFTIRSMRTGTRYTFRVNKAKENPRYPNSDTHFVSLLAGPDNTQDYVYMGIISKREFRTTQKSRFTPTSVPVAAFKWLFDHLQHGAFPPHTEMWHEGRCGRCGRKLTVPESIERGIGPECAGLMTR